MVHGHDDRRRSYELVAEAAGLTPRSPAAAPAPASAGALSG
jgi:hypothetical protein